MPDLASVSEDDWEVIRPRHSSDSDDTGVEIEATPVEEPNAVPIQEVILKAVPEIIPEVLPEVTATPEPAVEQVLRELDSDPGNIGYHLMKRNLIIVACFVLLGLFGASVGRTISSGPATPQEHLWASGSESSSFYAEQVQTLENHLARTWAERDHWRTLAGQCEADFQQILEAHFDTEEHLRQSKWSAPLAFVPTSTPRFMASAESLRHEHPPAMIPPPEPIQTLHRKNRPKAPREPKEATLTMVTIPSMDLVTL
eukprot:Nitzschia sp. Nitz4//scaffold178_size73299//46787//47554//NITZ4_005710-RA/size73299-processed-gene-0.13-mRNA-1//1//CDS//3329539155//1984//frame0